MKYPRHTEVQPTCLPIAAMTNGQTPWEVHHKPMQSGGLPCLRPPAFHIHGKWVPFSTLLPDLLHKPLFKPVNFSDSDLQYLTDLFIYLSFSSMGATVNIQQNQCMNKLPRGMSSGSGHFSQLISFFLGKSNFVSIHSLFLAKIQNILITSN